MSNIYILYHVILDKNISMAYTEYKNHVRRTHPWKSVFYAIF